MKKRVFEVIGFLFLIVGLFFVAGSLRITGFTVADEFVRTSRSFLGILFVIGGILFIIVGRELKEGALEIFISQKALERAKRDRKIKENIKRYRAEIQKIAADPHQRPQEILGEFHVSPQGHTDIRVAWHYEPHENRLYIDDLLYHRGEKTYVDKWNEKAARRKITRRDYQGAEYKGIGAL